MVSQWRSRAAAILLILDAVAYREGTHPCSSPRGMRSPKWQGCSWKSTNATSTCATRHALHQFCNPKFSKCGPLAILTLPCVSALAGFCTPAHSNLPLSERTRGCVACRSGARAQRTGRFNRGPKSAWRCYVLKLPSAARPPCRRTPACPLPSPCPRRQEIEQRSCVDSAET